MSQEEFRWETDIHGDALYLGDQLLGCIYNKNPYGTKPVEWRILIGEEMKFFADVKGSHSISDTRMDARVMLEAACSHTAKLPTAEELMAMTDGERGNISLSTSG